MENEFEMPNIDDYKSLVSEYSSRFFHNYSIMLLQSISDSTDAIEYASQSAIEDFSQILNDTLSTYQHTVYDTLLNSVITSQERYAYILEQLSPILSEHSVLQDLYETSYSVFPVELRADISSCVIQAEPFINDEIREKCHHSICAKLREKLTLSDIFNIINFLFTLITLLLACLPDPQLDVLLENQSHHTNQLEEIIENQSVALQHSQEENQALLEAISSLTSTVNRLNDYVEEFQEQLDDSKSDKADENT